MPLIPTRPDCAPSREQDGGLVPIAGPEALHRMYPRLRRLAAVAGALGEDPDDLVQEAFARALAQRPLHEFDDLEPYLCRTIFNLASNERRTRGRGRDAFVKVGRRDGDDAGEPSDLAILERLSVPSRTVVYLVDVEGFTFAEAAHLMGCSELAARSRASRARRQLRKLLEGMDDV